MQRRKRNMKRNSNCFQKSEYCTALWSGVIGLMPKLPPAPKSQVYGSKTVYRRKWAVATLHCALYRVHCTVFSVQCSLYTVHASLCTVHCAVGTLHCTLCTLHCALCSVQCSLYTVQCAVFTVHYARESIQCILHCAV